MRICHLGKYYFPVTGGIETHVRTLAKAQSAEGASVRVVCIGHQDASGQDVTLRPFAATQSSEEQDGDIRVTRIGRRFSLARWDVCPGMRRQLRQLLDERYDIVHLHVPNPTMLLTLASLRIRVPLVITHHSDIVRQKLLGWGLRPFELAIFRQAASIIATSPEYAGGSNLLSRYADRVEVLPFGVDLTPFQQPSEAALRFAARLRDEYGKPLWLSIVRLVYYKGLETAVRVLRHVPGRWIVIGTGPLENSLRDLAEQQGVSERIVWLGPATDDQVVGALQAATALWFPSNMRSEAFGLVQVEAMASGCPVINCNIPHSGVPWVSRHNETGLTVSVNSPEQFAAAARRLDEEAELWTRLSVSAQRRAAEHFGHRQMARQSLDLYRRVLSRSAPVAEELIHHGGLQLKVSRDVGD